MIAIIFNLRTNVDFLVRFVESIPEKYRDKVSLVVLNILGAEQPELSMKFSWLNIDPEDSQKTLQISHSIAQQMGHVLVYMNIEESVVLKEDFVPVLLGANLENQNVGLMYSDFEIVVKDNAIPIINTNFPPKFTNIPFAIIKRLPPDIFQNSIENKMEYTEFISKVFIVKHIPQIIYSVINE